MSAGIETVATGVFTAPQTYTFFDMATSRGYVMLTNDSDTFQEGTITVAATTYHGLAVKQPGLYVVKANVSVTTPHAIAHGTKRAALGHAGPFNHYVTSIDYGLAPVAQTNVGVTGGIDAADQGWDLYQEYVVSVPVPGTSGAPPGQPVYPSDAFIVGLVQESGFNASALPSLWMMRLSDPVPGGLY